MTLEVRNGYSVRTGQLPEDASRILALWGASLPALSGEAGERKLRTMYMENPGGTGALFLLQDPDGLLVGVMGLGSRTYRFGNATIRGGTMADLTVAPGHRTLGPALTLVRGALAESRDDFDFLCGFPNERSEAVLARAGYAKLGGMTRYARPLRSAAYARAEFGRWWGRLSAPFLDVALWLRDTGRCVLSGRTVGYREENDFDASFDSLWAKCPRRPLLTAERSRRVLTWYFSKLAAGQEWRVSTVRMDKSSELQGYAIWRIVNGVAQIADFLWSDATVGRTLLERLAWSARSRGCTSIGMEFSGSPDIVQTLHDAGFHARESRPVYYVPGNLSVGSAFDEWYLTGFDRDAF